MAKVRTPATPDWFHMELSGTEKIAQNFAAMTREVRDKLLKQAMRATTKPIEQHAKALVKRRTGALQDSISTKMTSKGAKGEILRAWVGPERNAGRPMRAVTRGKKAGQIAVAVPTRYAHLIEFGHRIVDKSGKVVGFAPPRPFMRPAWGAAGGDIALDTFATSLKDGIASLPSP